MDPDIASLLSTISFWETWGYVALGAVLLGVVGESVKEFSKWPERIGWEKKLGRVSALVLIAGLAGEGITQPNTNAANATLVAFVNKQAAQARLEIARLNARRELNPAQFGELVTALRQYKDWKYWVQIERADQDASSEQSAFGTQLEQAFDSAGWHRDNRLTPSDPKKVEPEVTAVRDRGCNLAASPSSQPVIDVIFSHLHDAGIDCDRHPWPDLSQTAVILEIGLR